MSNKEYIDNLNARSNFEGVFLKEVRENARAEGIPVMLKETAQLLSDLVSLHKPTSIMEIGTAVGYSGSLMLRHASPNCKLTSIEMSDSSIAKAKHNFEIQGLDKQVTIFQGDASEIIPIMSGTFDFIFLDGPKSRYLEYYPYLKRMLVKGGAIISDNVLFRGMISGSVKAPHKMNAIVKHMRAFLEELTLDSDFITTVYDIGDGVSISVKQN